MSAATISALLTLGVVAAMPNVRYAAEGTAAKVANCPEGRSFMVEFQHGVAAPEVAGLTMKSLVHTKTSSGKGAERRTQAASRKAVDAQANLAVYCSPAGSDVKANMAKVQQARGALGIQEVKKVYLNQAEPPIWNLDRINQVSSALDGNKDHKYTGQGVMVYVADTGCIEHPEYADRMLPGWSGFEGQPETQDDNGHGTHCAGTVAGTNVGVAPGATIIPLKVFGGSDDSTSEAIINESINYATMKRTEDGEPTVISMSLGGKRSEEELGDAAIRAAIKAGVIVSVAAGNDARDSCGYWPAGSHGVLTVGATATNGTHDSTSSFSNWGRCTNIYAPGTQITSSWNDGSYNAISGTSMACPAVSGAVALRLEANPYLGHEGIIAELKSLSSTFVGTTEGNVGQVLPFLQVETVGAPYAPGPLCPANGPFVCPKSFIGDGVCDAVCYDDACGEMDGGDCDSTCSDGLRNGDEVLADCGGSCDACPEACAAFCVKDWRGDGVCDDSCNVAECGFDSNVDGATIQDGDCAPFCNDGIQNGDEEQRDCGGSCAPCGEEGQCPFLETTGSTEMLGCADGTQCNITVAGFGCCVEGGHGGRMQCPDQYPFMCGTPNVCGGGKDYCCGPEASSCAGNVMQCTNDATNPFAFGFFYKGAMGAECPHGEDLATETECKEALMQMGMTSSMDPSHWWSGDYQAIQTGCSWRMPGHQFQGHFNAARGQGHEDRQPVCKKAKAVYGAFAAGAKGEECAEGKMIETEEECMKAFTVLEMDPSPMWTGDYSVITGGCSYRESGGNFRGHFNSAKIHKASENRAPICHA